MKTIILILTLCPLYSFAQNDTIFSNNDTIICNIKEVTSDGVKYLYPNEDVINTMYQKLINKIVFKSGRTQTFSEFASLHEVNGIGDYERVAITMVFNEVQGLYKIGDVSSKARGGTEFANMENVKSRAMKKLKIQAAMLGANLIYISQFNTTPGDMWNDKEPSTNLAGIAYTNKLLDYNKFSPLVNLENDYISFERISLYSGSSDFKTEKYIRNVKLLEINNENGIIMATVSIKRYDENLLCTIPFFNKDYFILAWKANDTIYNLNIHY